jgi:type II secretion system protein I
VQCGLAKRSNGFTLLEVLVALSILAASYGVILSILGGASRNASVTADYRRALIVAESQLSFAAASITSSDFEHAGLAGDKFRWQVTYSPTEAYSIENMPPRFTPVIVNIQVSWDDANGGLRSLSLSTVRLVQGRPG